MDLKKFLCMISVAFLLPLIHMAQGDTPPPDDNEYRLCSKNMAYCARAIPDESTIVYKVDGQNFYASEVYRIHGYYHYCFLSNDGQYFVITPSNLLGLDYITDTVLLTILKNGKAHLEIKLSQVLNSLQSLQRTASHYLWCESCETMGFGNRSPH